MESTHRTEIPYVPFRDDDDRLCGIHDMPREWCPITCPSQMPGRPLSPAPKPRRVPLVSNLRG